MAEDDVDQGGVLQDGADYVVAAYRDGDDWNVAELKASLGDDVEALAEALGRLPSGDVVAMVSVNEDYVVVMRRVGSATRVLLSDVTAVTDSDIAVDIADLLDLPDFEDDDEPVPGGDLELLADLGVSAADLTELCTDDDIIPDDLLVEIADQMGFADELEEILG